MATSFVEMHGKGFWCHDSLLEVWAYLMSDLLRGASAPGLAEYSEYLRVQATAGFHGCIDLRFDDLDGEARDYVARSTVRLLGHVSAQPELLTAKHWNGLALGGGQVEYGDVPIGHLRALTNHIVMLLRGEWQWCAGDKQSLPEHWLAA